MTFILVIFVGCVLLTNYRVFGSFGTPYDRNNARIGLFGYPPLWKAYWLALDGTPVLGEAHPMLFRHMPWLWLVPAGAISLLPRFSRSIIALSLSVGATFALYFNHNDLWPGNLYRYRLIHYLVWTFPLLWVAAYLGVRAAFTSRVGRISLASVIVAAFLISRWHLKEIKVREAAVSEDDTIISEGDFLILPQEKDDPAVSRNGMVLTSPYGIIFSLRPDGYAVVPKKGTSVRGLLVRPDSPDKRMMVGRLRWVFRLR